MAEELSADQLSVKQLAWVIEDDANLSRIFSEAVKHAGFRVEAFLSGDLVVQALDSGHPQLIVLDLHIPEVSGVELLHMIRSSPTLSKVTILLATADPLLADLYRDEADIVLIKPVSFGQLRDLATRLAGTASN